MIFYSLILFLALSFTSPLDVTVDTSLTSDAENSTRTLQNAFSLLYNQTTGQLYQINNSITLLQNVIGNNQTLSNIDISNFGSYNSPQGNIAIKFENNYTQLLQPSDCLNLPVISITAASFASLSLTGLSQIIFQGVYLAFQANSTQNQLNFIDSLIFNNVCLQDDLLNPNDTLTSVFELGNIYNLTFNDTLFIHNGEQIAGVIGTYNATFTNLKIYLSNQQQNNSLTGLLPMFSINWTSTIFAQNLIINCLSSPYNYTQAIFDANIIPLSFSVLNSTFANCTFQYVPTASFVVRFAANVTFDQITVTNLTAIAYQYFYRVFVADSSNYISITNIVFDTFNSFAYASQYAPSAVFISIDLNALVKTNIFIKNLTVRNCAFNGSSSFVILYHIIQTQITNYQIEDLTVIDSTFYAVSMLQNSDFIPGFQLHTFSMLNLFLTNVNISNCKFNETNFILMTSEYNTLYLFEPLGVQIQQMYLNNNTFNGQTLSFIEVVGTQLNITNLIASNLQINTINFIFENVRISTLILTNSTFENITLDSGATLFDYETSLSSTLSTDSNYYINSSTVQTETRPFILNNTAFNNVSLRNQSVLISSCNPMIIISNCNFTSITSNESNPISLGSYVPFLQSNSYDTLATNEEMVLGDLTPTQLFYNQTRGLTADYTVDSQAALFFIIFQNVRAENISSTNNRFFLSVSDLTLQRSIVCILSSNFTDSQVSTNQDFILILLSEISQTAFQGNIIQNMIVDGTFFSISSTAIQKLLIDTNTINSTQTAAGYLISSSECGDINFTGGVNLNLTSQYTWMQIDCEFLQTQLKIQNSQFIGLQLNSTNSLLFSLSFMQIILISSSSVVNDATLSLSNNSFENISVDKTEQKYSRTFFNSPVFQFALSGGNISLQNNQFINLLNTPDDNIISLSASSLIMSNSTFSKWIYYDLTGAIYLVLTNITINNCTFESNQGPDQTGGGLFTLVNPDRQNFFPLNATIFNSSFSQNIAYSSSLILFQDSNITLTITNSNFSDNFAQTTGVIFLQDSNVVLLMDSISFFLSNQVTRPGNYSNNLLEFMDCNGGNIANALTITNTYLSVRGTFTGSLIVLQNTQIQLAVSDMTYIFQPASNFLNNLTYAGLFYPSIDNITSFGLLRADLFNATFKNINVTGLNLTNTSVFELSCTGNYPSNLSGILRLDNNQFNNINLQDGSNILLVSDSLPSQGQACIFYLEMQNSYFSYISSFSPNGGLINVGSSHVCGDAASQNLFLNASNNWFRNISTNNGSIYLGPRLASNSTISFTNSSFKNISARGNGGVFYLKEAITSSNQYTATARILAGTNTSSFFNATQDFFTISWCNFTNISAANGGVFFSSPSNNTLTTLTLQNNTFNHTNATYTGGVVCIGNTALNIKGNTFVNVSAVVTGPIIYSDQIRFNPQYFESSNTFLSAQTNSSGSPNALQTAFEPNTLIVDLFSTDFAQLDFYSNQSAVIKNVSSFQLDNLHLTITLGYRDPSTQTLQPVVNNTANTSIKLAFNFYKGQTVNKVYDCSGSVCDIYLSQLTLIGEAGTAVEVDLAYISPAPSQPENSFQGSYDTQGEFFIEVRECVPGEINETTSGACTACLAGVYSLNTSDKYCKVCPTGANCTGGSYMLATPGYWRNSTESDQFIACQDGDNRCLGGYESACADFYQGPVCLQCNNDLNYLAKNNGQCTKCSSEDSLVWIAIIMLVGSIIYQSIVIFLSFRDGEKASKELKKEASLSITNTTSAVDSAVENEISKPGAYAAVLTTYAQMCSIFSQLMNEEIFGYFIGVPNTIGNPNQQIFFSLQCLLFLTTNSQFNILRVKTALFVLSPLIKITAFLIIELLRWIIKRGKEDSTRIRMRIGVVSIGLIIFEQPGIIGALCEYLSCVALNPFDSARYVAINTNVQCGTPDYIFFRNALVIPALILWGFLIPVGIAFILFKKKEKLNKSKTLFVVFGFLYSNYTTKAFYWGIATVIFKIVVFVANSLLTFTALGKGIVLSLIIHLYYRLFKKNFPNFQKDLNRAEALIIRSYMWTIVLILIRGSIANTAFQMTLEILIGIVNFVAVGYLLFRMILIYYKTMTPLFNKIKEKCSRKNKTNSQMSQGEKQGQSSDNKTNPMDYSDEKLKSDNESRIELIAKINDPQESKNERLNHREGSYAQLKIPAFSKPVETFGDSFIDLKGAMNLAHSEVELEVVNNPKQHDQGSGIKNQRGYFSQIKYFNDNDV